MLKRINFFGVPSVGKTTIATGFFHYCKAKNHNCEIISELARDWAYTDRFIKSFDQIYLTASQMHREDTLLLRKKVDFVISDSPILLNVFYSAIANENFTDPLIDLHALFEDQYPSMNFYIRKNEKSLYNTSGRHHDLQQLEELKEKMDLFLANYVDEKKLFVIEKAEDLDFENIYIKCGFGGLW